jgi:hypothetical protein
MPLDELVRLIPGPVADGDWIEDIRQKLLFLRRFPKSVLSCS